MPDNITIDGVGPMPVVRPASAAEVGELVRRCAAEGAAIYPFGGGTMLDYGLPPARPGLAVDLRSLDRVIDFPAADMTITVEAGITIARLAEITRAEGLHLPIDVPDPERATLGGAIACNVSGPRRYGYGTFRDYVLGITTVNDRGELVSAGGRVVKNVAGYDLMKLHTGALGTLGIITQVTLKLKPVPEARATCLFCCPGGRLAKLLDVINLSATRPTRISYRRRIIWDTKHMGNDWGVVVEFEGNSEAVRWQDQQFRNELATVGISEIGGEREVGLPELPVEQTIGDFVLRAGLRPAGAADFCEQVPVTTELGVVGFANGIVAFCDLTTPADWTHVQARRLIEELSESAEKSAGSVTIRRCRSDWKPFLPIWGRPPADLALQKAVKRALDPKNIFNPGRFVTDAF